MNRNYAKMNQRYISKQYSFSTHVRRTDKIKLPLTPVYKLGSTHLLTKNCNKIEENILKHRSKDSRNGQVRKCNF